ncbi:hypothetical protein BDN72DRAFT_898176 [Pluteus cervinus]|uniref:Uncharacterized protein n=1 Tax=Pluteus cervinus TaxID=181527 RepID=A0ACD3ASB0_9AGAR|nr:hypothetical protein BDN72DRAFT_898176 [Pluteus cervinus]
MPNSKIRKSLLKIDYEINSLKRRIQDLRSSRNAYLPVSSLPPYILTNIFCILRDEYALKHGRSSGMRTVMRLTWVCRWWRNSALEYPLLWAGAIHLGSGTRHNKLVSAFVQRSNESPLRVTLTPGLRSLSVDFDFLIPILPQIYDLDLDLGWRSPPKLDRGMVQKFWTSSVAPILRTLTLRGLVVIPRESFLNRTRTNEEDITSGLPVICDSPALRTLSLTWCRFSSGSLSHPFLTSLTIVEPPHSFGVSDLLQIISGMPSLEQLKLVRAFTRLENDEEIMAQDLPIVKTPSKLKSFIIEESVFIPVIQIFRHLVVDNSTLDLPSSLHIGITFPKPPDTAEVYSNLLRAIQQCLYPNSGWTSPNILDGTMEISYSPKLTFALISTNPSRDRTMHDTSSHSMRVQVNNIDSRSKGIFASILKLFRPTDHNDHSEAYQMDQVDVGSESIIPLGIPIRIHTLAITSYAPRPVFDFLSMISDMGIDDGIRRIRACYDAVEMVVDYLTVQKVDDHHSNLEEEGQLGECVDEGDLGQSQRRLMLEEGARSSSSSRSVSAGLVPIPTSRGNTLQPILAKTRPFPSLKSLHLVLVKSGLSNHSNPSSHYAEYSPSSPYQPPYPHLPPHSPRDTIPEPHPHQEWKPLCQMIKLRKEHGLAIEWLTIELPPETRTPLKAGRRPGDGDWNKFKLVFQVGSGLDGVPVDWMKEFVGKVNVCWWKGVI